MKRTLFATLFAVALCAPLAAQVSPRPTATPARPAATPARPAATPARPTATPAQPAARPTPAPTQPVARPTPAPTPTPAAAVAAAPANAESLPEILAVVNGIKITSKEIEDPIRAQVEELQKQIAEARKRELDLQINSLLLEAEAKKRGVSTTKLLEQEVVAKTATPTAAEAQTFFDQNKARIEEQAGGAVAFKDVQANIVSYLHGQRQQEMAKALADRLRAGADVKVLAAEATPPASAADRARVFATVNGKPITSAMIEDALKPLVYAVQSSVYQLRKQQLDLRVNDVLLGQEAAKRQMTPNALLEAELGPKRKPVTEADARAFYDQNRERINGEFAQIKDQIISYLRQQQEQALTSDYATRLRAAAALQLFLREPVVPVYEIATDDQPSKGGATAPVTVVEFTDYQCPSCAAQAPVLERLLKEYGDQLRLVVRDYPLSMHPDAFKAAEAAEAARAQGRYWEYVALLYANQNALGEAKLREYALRAGLDLAKFDAALASGQYAESVRRDMNDGNRVGVGGTPSLFVNGRPVEDRSYEGLKSAIDAALKAKAKG